MTNTSEDSNSKDELLPEGIEKLSEQMTQVALQNFLSGKIESACEMGKNFKYIWQ
tara:strand:+ start:349 stop:513 length:165 start_codon:yes stop_codon:yes gene_type:complete